MSEEREIKVPETDFEKVLFLNAYIKSLKIEHGKEISELQEQIHELKKVRQQKQKEKKPRPGHVVMIEQLTQKNNMLKAEITKMNETIFQLKKKYESNN